MTRIQDEEGSKSTKYNIPTIKWISDKLWDEFMKILPKIKLLKTVGRPVVLLHYRDPSTNREYVDFVDPDCLKIDDSHCYSDNLA